MSNINKHPIANHQDIGLIYSQTKELEKGMKVALEQLSSQYQQTLEKVKQSTDAIIDSLREWESRVFDELDQVKDDIVDRLNSKWKQFKDYGRHVRKNYLGEQKRQSYSSFPLHEVKDLIQLSTVKLASFENITDHFEEKCVSLKGTIIEISTGHREKSLNQSEKTIIHDFPQISPIKPNFREGVVPQQIVGAQFQKHLQFKENTRGHKMSAQNQQNELPVKKFKTQIHEDMQENSRRSHCKLKQSKSVRTLFASPGIGIDRQTKSPLVSASGTRRTSPIFPDLRSLQAIESPKYSKESKIKRTSKMRGILERNSLVITNQSVLSSTRRKDASGISSPKQIGDSTTKRGYNLCLQKLSKQQKQYERIKRGLS